MPISQKDKDVLRLLAMEYAEIAALPEQEESRARWRALNALKPKRPLVMIDQVCWNELEKGEKALEMLCEDETCRRYEELLRHRIYQWHNFRVDMVADPYLLVRKAIVNSGYGIKIQEETLVGDPTNDVLAHRYIDILKTDEDIERITLPTISHDVAETERRMELADDLFHGILPVYAEGAAPVIQIWDYITHCKGVESSLYAMIDEPEFVHRMVSRMVWSLSGMMDQMEEQGLLATHQTIIHCTGAYTDELPAPGYNPEKPRLKDIWSMGLAQLFCNVSGEMFDEYEIEYIKPLCERFGMIYYGCCDPLDRKMEYVEKIPNLRKVSMSPWVNIRRGAEAIAGRYVYSRKPNPSLLASDAFNEDIARRDLIEAKEACDETGCPLEIIMKDISTIRYDPARLSRWAEIAMDVVES